MFDLKVVMKNMKQQNGANESLSWKYSMWEILDKQKKLTLNFVFQVNTLKTFCEKHFLNEI